jgi:hypothetical protein
METVRKTYHWLLPSFLILVSVVALVASSSAEATVDGPVHFNKAILTSTMPQAPSVAVVEDEAIKVEAATPDNDALVRHLYDAMRSWTSLPSEAKDPVDASRASRNAASRARLAATASDIVTVARSEEPLFEGDADRSRSAVLVATVAFFESGFAEYVDKGECNDWDWKHPKVTGPDAVPADEIRRRRALLAAGPCDGGLAYSDWQIHPFDSRFRDGMVLFDGARAWAFAADINDGKEHEVIYGKDMIADRKKAARVALHMLRRALGRGADNLCGYTGERGDCPKGAQRLKFAVDWSRRHPFSGN